MEIEKQLPKFSDVEDKLRNLGNHTYSPYENPEYSELLFTIKNQGDKNLQRRQV